MTLFAHKVYDAGSSSEERCALGESVLIDTPSIE